MFRRAYGVHACWITSARYLPPVPISTGYPFWRTALPYYFLSYAHIDHDAYLDRFFADLRKEL
jgi:hypothetical protein